MGNTDPLCIPRMLPLGSSLQGIVTHFFLIPGSLHALKMYYIFCYSYEETFHLDRSRMQSDPEVLMPPGVQLLSSFCQFSFWICLSVIAYAIFSYLKQCLKHFYTKKCFSFLVWSNEYKQIL